jgi:hypothetical protein
MPVDLNMVGSFLGFLVIIFRSGWFESFFSGRVGSGGL